MKAPADVGGLLDGVRHLALGRAVLRAGDQGEVLDPELGGETLGQAGADVAEARGWDARHPGDRCAAHRARCRRGRPRSRRRSDRRATRARRRATSRRLPAGRAPSPARCARSRGSFASPPRRPAPSCFTSSSSGRERRWRCASSTSAAAGGCAKRGAVHTEQRPQSRGSGSSSSSWRTRIRQRPSVPYAAIAVCSARRSAVTCA